LDEVDDFTRRVLQVIINGDDVVAATVCQTAKDGVVLAIVAEQIDVLQRAVDVRLRQASRLKTSSDHGLRR
jgi:archaellum component FlaG (FlaF/FlaG flagellin family)